MIIYISIGNSDNRLTQAEWSKFWIDVASEVVSLAETTHGAWFSNPVGPYQNAAWCLEFATEREALRARAVAIEVRHRWGQESIAWAVAETEFI